MLREKYFCDFRTRVLSIKIITLVDTLLKKVNINFSFASWVTIFVLELIFCNSIFLVLRIGSLTSAFEPLLWVNWGGSLTAICIILIQWNLEQFLKVLDRYSVDILGSEATSFREWLESCMSIKRQLLFSLIFSTILTPISLPFYVYFLVPNSVSLFALEPLLGSILLFLFAFLNIALIGNGVYWVVYLPGAVKIISVVYKPIKGFDFKNIAWVEEFSDIYQRATLSTSIIGVALLLPAIANPSNIPPNIRVITMVWLLVVWMLVLVPYIFAQAQLSSIIRKERLLMLDKLQKKIYVLAIEKTNGKEVSEIEQLLSLYSKVSATESSVWSIKIVLRFFNSLLLPIISFLVINYVTIIAIVQSILD